jgi:hypothetical protein
MAENSIIKMSSKLLSPWIKFTESDPIVFKSRKPGFTSHHTGLNNKWSKPLEHPVYCRFSLGQPQYIITASIKLSYEYHSIYKCYFWRNYYKGALVRQMRHRKIISLESAKLRVDQDLIDRGFTLVNDMETWQKVQLLR